MSLEQTLLNAECVIPRSHGHSGERSNNFTKGPIAWVVQEQSGTIQTRVAMPAHSKEASIEKAILSATQFADEPFVTDDDSMGEIILITEAFGVIAVCHEANQGSGEAFQTISSVVRRIGAGTLVDGSAEGIPAYRKVGMKALDTATVFAGNGLSVTDSQGGFWAYGRREIEAFRISGEGMSAGPEVLVQASDHRLQIAEVPIQVHYGIKGTSSENPISQGARVLIFFWDSGGVLDVRREQCGDLHVLGDLPDRGVSLYCLYGRVLDADPRAAARGGGDDPVFVCADSRAGEGGCGWMEWRGG